MAAAVPALDSVFPRRLVAEGTAYTEHRCIRLALRRLPLYNQRPMRLALVLVLAWSLVPGLREVAESGVIFARTGQVQAAHTPGTDTDLGRNAPEHSCGGAMHFCSCCPSQPVVSGFAMSLPIIPPDAPVLMVGPGVALSRVGVDPPFRPPIA